MLIKYSLVTVLFVNNGCYSNFYSILYYLVSQDKTCCLWDVRQPNTPLQKLDRCEDPHFC